MSTPETALTSTPGTGTARGGRASGALLKLQADERLVAHVRRGNEAAFEVLVARYQVRLLAFCRHMLGSGARRDAEDVLQEVFASAYRAMLGDTRPINVRPWLYRIARNRCLNHLRRDPMPSIEGMEMTVVDERIGTAETVHQRAEVRQLLADIQALPETQRTAILLREIDDLSYEQIALAMDNTVAAVKSLLVRARVGLAEAAESRRLSCDEVRFELGQHSEGLVDKLTPPTRRHLKECKSCAGFQQDLKDTNKALAMLAPAFGIVILVKSILGGHAGGAAAGGAAGGAAAASGGGLISIGGVVSAKTMTGLAAAVAVTGAAVEVKHVTTPSRPAVTEQQQARVTQPPTAPAAAQPTNPSGGVAPAVAATTPDDAKASRSEDEPEETTPGTTPDDPAETTPLTTPASAEFPTATTPGTTPPSTPTIEDRTATAELPDIEDRTDEVQVRQPIRLPVPVPVALRPKPSSPAPAAPAPSTTPAPQPSSQAPAPAPQPSTPAPAPDPVPSTPPTAPEPAPSTPDAVPSSPDEPAPTTGE